MPFKSKAQQGYMFIHHPELAKEFAAHTTNYKDLPEHVKRAKKRALRKLRQQPE